MKKRVIILGFVIVLIIIFIIVFYIYEGPYANYNNQKIDYSCNTDNDCVVKSLGCDCCGHKSGCVNKKSVNGICKNIFGNFMCQCIHLMPQGCKCVNNKCEDISLFDEE